MFIDDCCRIHWNRPKATQESLKSCEIPQLLDLIWLSITNVLICFTESEPVEASRVDDKATECVAEVEETQSEAVETPTEVEETQAEVSQDAVVADVAPDVASPSTAHQSNTTRVSENWSKMILEDHWWLGNNSHFFESQSKLSSAKELQKMLQTASLRVPSVASISVAADVRLIPAPFFICRQRRSCWCRSRGGGSRRRDAIDADSGRIPQR